MQKSDTKRARGVTVIYYFSNIMFRLLCILNVVYWYIEKANDLTTTTVDRTVYF